MRSRPPKPPRAQARARTRGHRQHQRTPHTTPVGHATPVGHTTPFGLLGVIAAILTLVFIGTAAVKGAKTPSATATAPAPTYSLTAPAGAHGPPVEVSSDRSTSTGNHYRRDNERDPGREKDKDRNQARRCTRTAPGEPSPHRRPLPPAPRAAHSYPTAFRLPSHTGSAASLTTSRAGLGNRPALHCLHCVFRC
ncbi:hypothetical protein ACH4OW_28665 [Streptomyces sp. NPDC017056]|uniref:hypothetical protein n=1 Tax=Streptomyces sp. NPDC017056 TaxID=3364973 RepID=UPI00378F613F